MAPKKSLELDQIPPHSIEVERQLLSCIIMDPGSILPACRAAQIGKNHFYDIRHQTIFETIDSMYEAMQTIDLTMITHELIECGNLESAGGVSYITECSTASFTTAGYQTYVSTVKSLWLRRMAIRAGSEISKVARDGASAAEITEKISALSNIISNQKTGFVLKNLIDVSEREISNEDVLLGDRFLCRDGTMLFVGPSGIGKSSASVQQDILWACGREAFGIRPKGNLKILTVQAENDDGDLTEMSQGVIAGLGLTDEQREIVRQNVIYVSEKTHIGMDFIHQVVAPLLEKVRPDIIRIDPLLAYIGADPKEVAETAKFCRHGLNPLLEKYKCGLILNHHTPKTTGGADERAARRGSDWMYAGAGSADLTNWARAILVIDPTHEGRTFKFIAAKRGRRLNWADNDGKPCVERFFSHAENGIYWTDPTEEQIQNMESANPRHGKAQPGSYKPKTDWASIIIELIGDAELKATAIARMAADRSISSATFWRVFNLLKKQGIICAGEEGDGYWRLKK